MQAMFSDQGQNAMSDNSAESPTNTLRTEFEKWLHENPQFLSEHQAAWAAWETASNRSAGLLSENARLRQRTAELETLAQGRKEMVRELVKCLKFNGVGKTLVDCYDVPSLWDNDNHDENLPGVIGQ